MSYAMGDSLALSPLMKPKGLPQMASPSMRPMLDHLKLKRPRHFNATDDQNAGISNANLVCTSASKPFQSDLAQDQQAVSVDLLKRSRVNNSKAVLALDKNEIQFVPN